jgi:hypothetical protein
LRYHIVGFEEKTPKNDPKPNPTLNPVQNPPNKNEKKSPGFGFGQDSLR